MVSGPSRDVTILDDRGRLIARRGLTQGAMVRVEDLPDFVPNAFIAIEDRRFRSHIGIDPIGLTRAAYREHDHRPCRAGRLDPDPAARQESVSQSQPHLRPQDPGSDARAVSGVALLQGPDPHALSQPRLFRRRRFRHRGGGREILRQACERTEPARSGDAGGQRQGAGALQSPFRHGCRPRSARRSCWRAMQDAGFIDANTRNLAASHAAAHRARQRHAGLGLFRRLGHGASARLCRRHKPSR